MPSCIETIKEPMTGIDRDITKDNNTTMYNTEFNYEHYGVSDTVSEYLIE
ncbi:hypothetical protein [Prosthecochloris sp.]|nr:hypothetical protein [Prosthecochloris sp.]